MAEPENLGVIPTWSKDADWNTVTLGEVVLPGICMIKGLKLGVEVETKKAKGSDQPTSKDVGVDPSKFSLELRLAEKDWAEFLWGLPFWNPRRPGRARSPVEIIHPWVNAFGIKTVRVVNVEGDQPTARSGCTISISVEEWFDAPKEVKPAAKKPQAAGTGSKTVSEVGNVLLMQRLAEQAMERNRRDRNEHFESDVVRRMKEGNDKFGGPMFNESPPAFAPEIDPF